MLLLWGLTGSVFQRDVWFVLAVIVDVFLASWWYHCFTCSLSAAAETNVFTATFGLIPQQLTLSASETKMASPQSSPTTTRPVMVFKSSQAIIIIVVVSTSFCKNSMKNLSIARNKSQLLFRVFTVLHVSPMTQVQNIDVEFTKGKCDTQKQNKTKTDQFNKTRSIKIKTNYYFFFQPKK